MPRRSAALLVAALLAVVALGCGDDGDSSDSSPSYSNVPSGAVATVDGIEIEEQDLDDQVDALARAREADSEEVSEPEHKRLETQALSILVQRKALEQEAVDRGITVSRADVRELWSSVSQSELRTKFRRGMLGDRTEQDLLGQLRVQLLIEAIYQQVNDDVGGGDKGIAAVAKFRGKFQRRLRAKVECARGYKAVGCGRGSK